MTFILVMRGPNSECSLNSVKISWNSLRYFSTSWYSAASLGKVNNPNDLGLKNKGGRNLPNEIVPKHEELGYVLYGILEPELVTETKLRQFVVAGNWSIGADIVNFVPK
jgi:hypothetical protein